MAKLKNVILQLSESDHEEIFTSLIDTNAEKSAYLLKYLREGNLTDAQIMDKLEVNSNAYYTLRSRLNQKIEEYLLQQLENPRADLLKKVANVSEVVFTKNKIIAIATLKKLERQLIEYDLSYELTSVYKYLKKLHINTEHYFEYSQLYNRHVAFTLALDKAEGMVNEYSSKSCQYYLEPTETLGLELDLIAAEMANVSKLYDSHRLKIYFSLVAIVQSIFLHKNEELSSEEKDQIQKQLEEAEVIFENYFIDPVYFHLRQVFESLKFLYFHKLGQHVEAEKYYGDLKPTLVNFLQNYKYYINPTFVLHSFVEHAITMGQGPNLKRNMEQIFKDYDPDTEDAPLMISYYCFRSLACHLAGEYNDSARWLNQLLNEISFKNYMLPHMEIKLFLILQYALIDEQDLFAQVLNSLQRQVRMMGEAEVPHIVLGVKLAKLISGKAKRNAEDKLQELVEEIEDLSVKHFSLFIAANPHKLIEKARTV